MNNQTALVLMNGKCYEYPVSKPRRLGQAWSELGTRVELSVQMAQLGFDVPINRGIVYAYIENRREKFKHRYYGWKLPRE